MKVLKFGGSSLACAACIKQAGDIILSNQEKDHLTIVVSATGKTTATLIQTGSLAASGKDSYRKLLRETEMIHLNLLLLLEWHHSSRSRT